VRISTNGETVKAKTGTGSLDKEQRKINLVREIGGGKPDQKKKTVRAK